MRHSVILVVALFACGDANDPDGGSGSSSNSNATSQQTCSALEGNTYVTTEDQGSGTRCYFDVSSNYVCEDVFGSWSLTFDEGNVFWSKGQNSSYGEYRCNGDDVSATLDGDSVGGVLSGTVLTWEGDRYERS